MLRTSCWHSTHLTAHALAAERRALSCRGTRQPATGSVHELLAHQPSLLEPAPPSAAGFFMREPPHQLALRVYRGDNQNQPLGYQASPLTTGGPLLTQVTNRCLPFLVTNIRSRPALPLSSLTSSPCWRFTSIRGWLRSPPPGRSSGTDRKSPALTSRAFCCPPTETAARTPAA